LKINYLKKILVNSYNLNNVKIILAPHPTPNFFINKKKKLLSKKNITNFFLYPANFWEHKNHIVIIKAINNLMLKKKNITINKHDIYIYMLLSRMGVWGLSREK
jgi:hypothetical protein